MLVRTHGFIVYRSLTKLNHVLQLVPAGRATRIAVRLSAIHALTILLRKTADLFRFGNPTWSFSSRKLSIVRCSAGSMSLVLWHIRELRRKYPEVRLQTLEERLRNEGWHKGPVACGRLRTPENKCQQILSDGGVARKNYPKSYSNNGREK